jgi:hypothetical protein
MNKLWEDSEEENKIEAAFIEYLRSLTSEELDEVFAEPTIDASWWEEDLGRPFNQKQLPVFDS